MSLKAGESKLGFKYFDTTLDTLNQQSQNAVAHYNHLHFMSIRMQRC